MTMFFYDSYAVIEYLSNNVKFVPFFEEHTGVLTLLNVLEVYYSVLSAEGQIKADIVLETLQSLMVQPSLETIKKAMVFRLERKKQDLSYADCLGYQLALDRGIKFLTGDRQFSSLPNVEFLKR